MAESKRYYWLKLPEDFFRNRLVRKLKRLPGGDSFVVIYLELLLSSLNTGGHIPICGCEASMEEELALVIDEDEDNVKVTVQYLKQYGLLIESADEVVLPQVEEWAISEGLSAERNRRYRERKASQSDAPVTKRDENASQNDGEASQNDGEASHRDGTVTNRDASVTACDALASQSDVEIEKEIEIEIESEIDRKEKIYKKEKFKPPTVDEVRAYCWERGNTIDAEAFVAFYESKGWKVGNSPMKNWKAAIITWEKKEKPKKSMSTIDFYRQVAEEGL